MQNVKPLLPAIKDCQPPSALCGSLLEFEEPDGSPAALIGLLGLSTLRVPRFQRSNSPQIALCVRPRFGWTASNGGLSVAIGQSIAAASGNSIQSETILRSGMASASHVGELRLKDYLRIFDKTARDGI